MSDRRYPLCWPAGWPRTEARKRQRSRFKVGRLEGRARDGLLAELRRLGAGKIIVSTNVALRLDGLPYANQRTPDDPGVAVYFEHKGEDRSFACDRWTSVGDNMHAIAKSIEALRGLDRWGSSHMVDAAFRGFKALPAAEGYSSFEGALIALAHLAYGTEEGWERLRDDSQRRAAYRMAARKLHPDQGGDDKRFKQLTQLWRFLEEQAA